MRKESFQRRQSELGVWRRMVGAGVFLRQGKVHERVETMFGAG